MLGFKKGVSGGHSSRSMMLKEIKLLLEAGTPQSSLTDYKLALEDENVLGKPTHSSRLKSLSILKSLYGLDEQDILFRCFRSLYYTAPESLPQLALIQVFCRDSLLRTSALLIFQSTMGSIVPYQDMEAHFQKTFPDRFSQAMRNSLSLNVNTTWSFSGHLEEGRSKTRKEPPFTPASTTFAMLAAYLLGYEGQSAIKSPFGQLVSLDPSVVSHLLSQAHSLNMCDFKNAGGVCELRFPQLLTSSDLNLIL